MEKIEEKKNVIEIRKDLNDCVKNIGFKAPEKVKWGVIPAVCVVTFFNGEKVEFSDNSGLYNLLSSYKGLNEDGYKSKRLVECVRKEKEETENTNVEDKFPTYVCVEYELEDGTIFKMFPRQKYAGRRIIDNYYRQFKMLSKPQTK